VVGSGGTILKTGNGGGPPVGVNEKTVTNSLRIYPNPSKEKITIEPSKPGSTFNGNFSIYGMTGRELIRQKVQSLKVEININTLPQGIYFIRLMNSEKTEFGKFIKE
jgi:hypothetical protein